MTALELLRTHGPATVETAGDMAGVYNAGGYLVATAAVMPPRAEFDALVAAGLASTYPAIGWNGLVYGWTFRLVELDRR